MSTWMYLQCEDHNPPLRAESESGQHWYDVPQIIADLRDRTALLSAIDSGMTVDDYFRRHTFQFLASHRYCHITLWTEYGEEIDTTNGEKKEGT